MAVIRSLMTHFGFRVDSGKLQQLNTQITATKGKLRIAARQSAQFRRGIMDMGNAVKYAAAAFVASRFVKTFTTGFSEPLDKLAKFSRQVGINVETLQGLQFAGKIAGLEISDMQTAILRFSRSLRDANDGSKKIKKAFSDVGISLKDIPLDDQGKALMAIADRFKNLPAGANKAALAQELFGRSGAKLIPLLNEGSAGIEQLIAKARKLGIVVSEKTAKDAEKFNDSLTEMKAAFLGIRNTIAKELIPRITDLIKRFNAWYQRGNNARKMLYALKLVASAAAAAIAIVVTTKTIRLFRGFYAGIRAGISALRAFGTAGGLASLKIGLIVASLALLYLIIDDLYGFVVGKESVTEKLFKDPEDAKKLRRVLTEIFYDLKTAWNELKPAIVELGKALFPIGKAIFKALVPVLKFVFILVTLILRILTPIISAIMRFIARIASDVPEAIEGAKLAWEDFKTAVVDIWNAISNFIMGIINAVVSAWNAGTNAIKAAWNAVGNAIKAVANAVKRAWEASLGWVLDKVNWIVEKVLYAAQKLGVIKGEKLGSLGAGLEMTTRAIGRAGPSMQNVSNKASVGTINVTVTGSADMKGEEFQGVVRGGVTEAINDMIKSSFSNLRPLTT